uniref:Uncharacterized protein n=1 Tax=Acrobeloides nanus TaxID=290746 RepID=A0A914D707_9BILA
MVALHLGYFSPAIILFLALDYELDEVGAKLVHMDFCLMFNSEFWFYFLIILIFVQVLASFVAILVLFYVMKKKLFAHCEGGFNQGLCGDRRKFYLSSMIQILTIRPYRRAFKFFSCYSKMAKDKVQAIPNDKMLFTKKSSVGHNETANEKLDGLSRIRRMSLAFYDLMNK